ncbi:MAG: hypothetical protein H0U90_02705 [Actinobacteria bacterium]|nr:hypothetical protein [Actinomycetota bacterium]
MSADELWISLVDEPIGNFVANVQAADPDLAAMVASPQRQLVFRAFAYIRVGLVLGELLVEHGAPLPDPSRWVEDLLADPVSRARAAEEVRAVARDVTADPELAELDEAAPGAAAREQFLKLTRERLGG